MTTPPSEPPRPTTETPLALRAALVVGMLAAATGADTVTGFYVRVYPLYFVPVAYASLRLGRGIGVLVAVTASLCWLFANAFHSDGPDLPTWLWTLNTSTQALSFSFVSLLISELQRRLDSERLLARRDPLTGLHNARAFRELAERMFAGVRRHGRTCTLACVDLDGFKAVNDSLGHSAGDDLLRTVAAAMSGAVRSVDVVARMGGDEFVVLLDEGDPEAARKTLDRVRTAIQESVPRGMGVTASIGALVVGVGASVDVLLQRADTALYRAKAAGRNRVELDATPLGSAHGDTSPPPRPS